MGLQPVADRRLLVQHERDEPHTEQDEAGETQRRRTHDEEQRDPAGADHSAVRQQLSDAHWRVIIWRTPSGTAARCSTITAPDSNRGGCRMRVRRFAGCVAVALCAVWPASAAATIDGIALRPSGFADFLCIGSTSTAPVGLRLAAPDGSILQTLLLPTADDLGDAGCPASTHTFEPGASLPAGALQPAFNRYPAGGRITATQDGRSVTFALPYGAFSAGTTRLRALPNPAALTGGVVDPSASGTYDGPAATEGAPVSISGSVLDSSSAPVPITETVTPRQYRVVLESTFIQVLGADPLAGTLARHSRARADRPSGARRCVRASAATAASSAAPASSFDSPAPPGGTLAVSGQPGWFGARSITLPQASLRLGRIRCLDPGRRHRQLRLRAALLRPRDDLVARTDESASLSRARLGRQLLGRRAREPARRLGRRPVRGPR